MEFWLAVLWTVLLLVAVVLLVQTVLYAKTAERAGFLEDLVVELLEAEGMGAREIGWIIGREATLEVVSDRRQRRSS